MVSRVWKHAMNKSDTFIPVSIRDLLRSEIGVESKTNLLLHKVIEDDYERYVVSYNQVLDSGDTIQLFSLEYEEEVIATALFNELIPLIM